MLDFNDKYDCMLKSNNPGPGQYQVHRSYDFNRKKGSSEWGKYGQRFKDIKVAPGPGDYTIKESILANGGMNLISTY